MNPLASLFLILAASQTCWDSLNANPNLCGARAPTWTQQNCTAGCSVNECCRDWNCGEKLPSGSCVAPEVLNRSASCTQCDIAECCVMPTSCSQLDSLFCSSARPDLVFNFTIQDDACPGSCDVDWCCRPAQTCGEYPTINDLCTQSHLVPIFGTACDGQNCANTTLCCREPQACNELLSSDMNFCQSFAQVWNYSSSQFYDLCEGNCTADRCCRFPANCFENDQALQNFSCPPTSFKQTMSSISCTDCANECCVTPQTCDELFSFNPSVCSQTNKLPTTNDTLLHEGCGGSCSADTCCLASCDSISSTLTCPQDNPIFQYSTPCTTCDVAECCRKPNKCGEAYLACDEGLTVDPFRTCTNCTASECCRPIQFCGEASIDCAGLYLEQGVPCTFSVNCTVDVCCRLPSDCSQVPFRVCQERGLVQFQGNCSSGGCNATTCCRSPESCGEMAQVEPSFCSGLGVVQSSACSGVGCNTAVCCRPPSDCAEVTQATTYGFSSQWCAHQGFADISSFPFPMCTACTAAECCRPNTCAAWADRLPLSICSNGEVADATLSCDENGCSEELCCRPQRSCGETIYQVSCPIGTYVVSNASCSGGGCNEATCCTKATTCQEANLNFMLCSAAGMEPIRSSTVVCSGNCTASECCTPTTSCDVIMACPAGTQNHQGTCQGAQCSVEYCCVKKQTCYQAFDQNASLCKGFGLQMPSNKYCSGYCTREECCRPQPRSCGEADLLTGLCAGAVDYFKPCVGADCSSKAFCCREPVNCREALNSGSVVCSPEVPAHLNSVACPSGVCNTSTCCKAVATCGDQNVLLNGTMCGSMVLNSSLECGTGTPCDVATCCRPAANCEEARPSISCSANTLFNAATLSSACNPTCTAAQCCRAPLNCGEAYLNNQDLCGSLSLNIALLSSPCSNCVTTCCVPVTFAPTTSHPATAAPSAPSAPSTAAPSAPSTAAPTATPTQDQNTTHIVSGSASVGVCSALLACLLYLA